MVWSVKSEDLEAGFKNKTSFYWARMSKSKQSSQNGVTKIQMARKYRD